MKSVVFTLIAAMLMATTLPATAKGKKSNPPASIEAALEFLSSQQSEFGLVDSFVEDSIDYAYTYDNAMAAMAFISTGDLNSAVRIFEAYAMLGAENDGGFLHRYHANDGAPAFGIPTVGPNAYLLQALNLYRIETNDTGYDILAAQLADFLLAHQDVDGGLVGRAGVFWKSTENNLAALSAIHSFGSLLGNQGYLDAANSIYNFLVTECWDGTRFLTGENDPMIVTDAQALGTMVLGAGFSNGSYWIENHTQTTRRYSRGRRITGFDLNTDRDTVWTEGTLQQAMAFSVAGDPDRTYFYMQESEKLFVRSGAFRQASNNGSTGFGDYFTTWEAVAPTAWYILVANQDNVLQPM